MEKRLVLELPYLDHESSVLHARLHTQSPDARPVLALIEEQLSELSIIFRYGNPNIMYDIVENAAIIDTQMQRIHQILTTFRRCILRDSREAQITLPERTTTFFFNWVAVIFYSNSYYDVNIVSVNYQLLPNSSKHQPACPPRPLPCRSARRRHWKIQSIIRKLPYPFP